VPHPCVTELKQEVNAVFVIYLQTVVCCTTNWRLIGVFMLCFVVCHCVMKQSIDLHSAEVSGLKTREKELLHKVFENFVSEDKSLL